MEKHTCKLCFRCFPNGRALGGHMRSHVTAAPTGGARVVLPDSSASSFSTSSREDEEEEEAGDGKGSGLSYGLRENPRKSFRLVDPEFSSSFPAVVDAGSSVVQDRESDTESPRPPALQRPRSKRTRRGPPPPAPEAAEPGPASSVSDSTPEEDVAISLMMLSRDLWASGPTGTKSGEEAEERRLVGSDDDEEQQQEGWIPAGSRRRTHPLPRQQQNRRSRFQCETCKKSFRSYQALGGHRASHKKLKGCAPVAQSRIPDANSSDANADRGAARGSSKAHECPLCFRVFGSGQALGGHKRSHLPASVTTSTIASSPSPPPPPSPPSTSPPTTAKYGDCLLDLNLPAPMDDDLAELSVVSDAEFVVRHHQL